MAGSFLINNSEKNLHENKSSFEDLLDLNNFDEILTKVYYGFPDADNAILRIIDRTKLKIDSCVSSALLT